MGTEDPGTQGFAIDTPHLRLRRLCAADAPFMCTLLNDAAFLRYIGDRGVRTREDAERYILDGPVASYGRVGYGLYLVALRDGGEPVGICGPLRRDTLPDADLGFALLPAFRERGYAREAAEAVLVHARDALGLRRLLAITSQDNAPSIRLLLKLGFRFERLARISQGEPELNVFTRDL